MPRRTSSGRVAALVVLAAALMLPSAALAAPPAPCLGVVQVTDAAHDGHHAGTDVLSAWFSEESGHLQAVVKVRAATPEPEHTDEDVNGAGYVVVFSVGGVTHYVRGAIPLPGQGTPYFDHGFYTAVGVFDHQGSSDGTVEDAATGGTVTIDVPEETGAVAGAVLTDVRVVTYDGITGGVPHWVDHAPGGTSPTDTSRGADYVVGCGSGGGVAAVQLAAPAKVKGGRTRMTVTGKVLPEQAGVTVAVTRQSPAGTVTKNVLSAANGTFSVVFSIGETTRVRAEAEGISSQTKTITMHSTVRLVARRTRAGGARLFGVTRPALRGRLLLLPADGYRPVAAKNAFTGGVFRFTFKQLRPGRYQVVYVPAKGRAERSTSNVARLR
jgi:hypothetical protein